MTPWLGPWETNKKDLEFAEPAVWTCPQCGSAYLTPDLQPKCAVCGYREGATVAGKLVDQIIQIIPIPPNIKKGSGE